MHRLLIALALMLAPVPAFAGQTEATDCAVNLDDNGKLVFEASIAGVKPGVDLKALVTAKTKQLVMDGKLKRSVAKPAAMAAGDCLILATK